MSRRLISSGSEFEAQIGYSRAVVEGEWVFISGTTGFDYATMTIAPGVVEQAEQCLANIAAALEEAEKKLTEAKKDAADLGPKAAQLKKELDEATKKNALAKKHKREQKRREEELLGEADRLRAEMAALVAPVARSVLRRRKKLLGTAAPARKTAGMSGYVCPECGLEYDSITPQDAKVAVRSFPRRYRALLVTPGSQDGPDAVFRRRAHPSTWSALEYACHVRDVYDLYDERLRMMLEQDDPDYPNWDQDAAAVQGDYGSQDPMTVAAAIEDNGARLAERFDSVDGDMWDRTGNRSDGATFTVTDPSTGEELATIYRNAGLFAFSSNEEGLGIVVLEAMASGVGVAATATEGARELIENNKTGKLIPIQAPVELVTQVAEAGRELLGDQGDEGDLAGVALAVEHAFAEEGGAEIDPVEAAGEPVHGRDHVRDRVHLSRRTGHTRLEQLDAGRAIVQPLIAAEQERVRLAEQVPQPVLVGLRTALQLLVVGELSLRDGIRLVGGGVVDILNRAARGACQQRGETKRDPSLAHFRQRHGSLAAPCTGEIAFPCADGVDRVLDVTDPLEGVPGKVEMSINDQHKR